MTYLDKINRDIADAVYHAAFIRYHSTKSHKALVALQAARNKCIGVWIDLNPQPSARLAE